jgi:hypothetical protein
VDLKAFLSGIRLSNPSVLILLAANLLPLVGILFWGWDAFVLLMLYWLETAIIGFWMLLRVASGTPGTLGEFAAKDGSKTPATALGLTLFFIVHAGMFMSVHFIFLWTLFSGEWASRIHGPIDFVRELVIGTGLWLPLLVLFVARGATYFYDAVVARWLARKQGRPEPAREDAGSVIGAFYVRIVVMHIAIILGGFLSFLGSVGPLIVMVALKTVIDLGMQAAFDVANAGKLGKALLGRQSRPAS